jgi:transposase
MEKFELFAKGLGLESPWYVKSLKLDKNEETGKEFLFIEVDFNKGSKFLARDQKEYTVYDSKRRTWQHLNFFQYPCFIKGPVPRLKLEDGSTHNVEVPWAREGSHFTLLFEAYCMKLLEGEMTFSKIGSLMQVGHRRVARLFNYWVTKARLGQNLASVTAIGIDENSVKKGHNYVTVAVDLLTKRVIHVSTGKDRTTLQAVKQHIIEKSGSPDQVNMMSMDMSPAFISGTQEYFPQAAITFDKFHVMKLINTAMDKTRGTEQKICKALKGTRYSWLKNDCNLKESHITMREAMMKSYPKIGIAYRLKQLFQTFWTKESIEEAKIFLIEWCQLSEASDLEHFQKVAQCVRYHMAGILEYIKSRINNGILEGINSKIQLAKRRARGYRNMDNFINMIYFISADLKFDYPS